MVRPGNVPVRLSDSEKRQILVAINEASETTGIKWTEIALFGSRVDLSKKGGDIDLYVKVIGGTEGNSNSFAREARIILNENLGDQKIDLVVDNGTKNLGAFSKIIQKEQVTLWSQI